MQKAQQRTSKRTQQSASQQKPHPTTQQMQKTFLISNAPTATSHINNKKRDYTHNVFNLGLPVDMPNLKAQFFLMDGEDIGLYCHVEVTDLAPDFASIFLAQYGKFLSFSASPDRFLREFLRLYPEALTWGDKIETLRSLQEAQGLKFDPCDPVLCRVDNGVSNFIREAFNLDSAWISILLNRDDALNASFRQIYESNNGKRAGVWEELAKNYRADFLNMLILLPDSMDGVDSEGIFDDFTQDLNKWLP